MAAGNLSNQQSAGIGVRIRKNHEIKSQNQQVWHQNVTENVGWTIAVDSEVISKARNGEFNIHLCRSEPVPRRWFPEQLSEVKILCLACGGGQQAPIVLAAGADVTVMDLSSRQLLSLMVKIVMPTITFV